MMNFRAAVSAGAAMTRLLERRPLVVLLGLWAGLAATIAFELQRGSREEQYVTSDRPPTASQTSGRTGPVAAPPEQQGKWAAVAIARPLFAPDRRPRAAAGVATRAPAVLPRLTGVMISAENRRAIFDSVDGAKSSLVSEGTVVAEFRVQKIEVGRVILLGPDGARVVRPSFDQRPAAVVASAPNALDTAPSFASPAPFTTGTDVMQLLRGLPDHSGAAR